MNARRWHQVGALFDAALELPPAERGRLLEGACRGDAELRREVERLLAADAEGAGFLEEPAFHLEERGRLGPYRLLEKIAEGGMGAVYAAERDDREFRRRVAIKLVRRDLARPEVVLRFRAERQYLAALEHPFIARLYDGGTSDDGRPYLVMEHVDGVPITEYCERRRLKVAARLELFLKVCDAVGHAHRHLLVHRDLKPSNVLVTRDGEPKLLDFGIAKLLGGAASPLDDATGAGRSPMTPSYASPEQVRGAAVTTASDVYSLGVLLHELVTGRRPHEGRLRGDLGHVTRKALREKPEERYGSVDELAEDLRRHLDHRPVRARAGTPVYLACKFVRRHRVGVLAAALLAIVGVVLDAASSRQSAAIRHLGRGVATRLHNLGTVTVNLGAVEKGETYLRDALELRRELEGDDNAYVAETKEALALARWTRGDYGSAETLLLEALATREDVCPAEWNYWAADAMSHLTALYARGGRLAEAETMAAAARRQRRLFGDHRPDRARSLDDEAHVLFARGDFAAAEVLYREALEIRRSLLVETASSEGKAKGEVRQELITSHHNLARCLGERGAYEEAEEHFGQALAMTRRLHQGASPEEATLLNNLAVVLGNEGEHATAEALFRRVLELRLELLGEEHPHVAQVRYSLGNLLHDQGNLDAAERLYRQAADAMARVLPEDHPAQAYPQVAMGRLLLDRGEAVAAEGVLREALARLEATHAPGHWRIADAESLLGGSLAAQGRYEEAEALMRPAYVTLQQQRSARSPRTRRALARLADLYRSREQGSGPIESVSFVF